MKKSRFLVPLAIGLLLLTACGASTPEPADITIHMDEFTYTPDTIQLKVGQAVTITLVNDGALDHEMSIGRLVVNNDQGQAAGFSTGFFASAGVTPTVTGGGTLLAPKSDQNAVSASYKIVQPVGADPTTLSFTVTQDMVGTWTFACFQQDGVHYQNGMKGELTVSQ